MKKINLLFLLIFLIKGSFCNNGGLLSKFHQNIYKIRDVRTQVINVDKNYFERLDIVTFKYNRTTPAINITAKCKMDLLDKVEAVVQTYKFLSNEYRHFPIRFQVNLNKAFQANVAGILKIRNCGNITNFYFLKGVVYHACNYVVDEAHMPPLIPNGKFKTDVELQYLNHPIALIHAFAELYTPIDYPKK